MIPVTTAIDDAEEGARSTSSATVGATVGATEITPPPWTLPLRPKPDRGPDGLRSAAFGDRIAAKVPDRQTAETPIRVALMNRFSALGTAEITRVA